MVFILRLVLISISCYGLGYMMPWWSIIVCAFVISFFLPGNSFNAFLSGFLGIGLVWLIMAWIFDMQSESNMSTKIVDLFPIDDHISLIIITGLIGAVAGGFSAVTGNTLRQLFIKKKKQSFYSS